MEELYNYVFHYNNHENLWSAIPRNVYLDYWNSNNVKSVLKSKEISTLIELINKGEEFIESVK